MSALGSIKVLSKALDFKESKVRRWTKMGILTPIKIDPKDGKTLLYNIECEKIKLEILESIRLDFNLDEIGKRFEEVFGRKNAKLLRTLQSASDTDDLIQKHVEKIYALRSI